MRIRLGQIVWVSMITAVGTQVSASSSSELVSLTDSLEPLKKAFNADSAKQRLGAILSPS